VVERKTFADLGVTQVRFANGVVLNVKPTQFRADQILVNARVAGGRLALPRDLVTWPATQGGFISGGLGKLTDEERKEALTGKVYSVGLGFIDDAFPAERLHPQGGPRHPDAGACRLRSDAAWRPEPFARAKSDLANLISQIETRPFGVTSARVPQVLRSGDQRWGLPDRAALAKADLAAARDAIQPALARGLVEINIVGDVTVDEAIAQTAATFGALPNRETKARRAPGGERVSLIPAGPRPVQLTHAGRPDVGLGMIVWQTDDFWDDPARARVVQVLRAVVELRALEKLREELGTTYSPNVQSETSEAFDEMGLLSVSAEVKPDQIAPLMQVIEEVANEIAAKGLTDDELNRARTPMLAQLEKDRAGNEFWLGRVGGSSWDPRRLESIRQQEALLRSVTLADVKAAAAAYLRPDRARRVVVNPPSNQAGAEGAAVKAASVEMRPDGTGRVVVTPSAPLAGGPN
jgi:zinc protease